MCSCETCSYKENEFEGEAVGSEFSGSCASEDNPTCTDAVSRRSAMEHLAHAAMRAENEFEAAEAFLPLMELAIGEAGPAAKQTFGPRTARRLSNSLTRLSPALYKGVADTARSMYRSRRTRPLVRVLPTVVRSTVGRIARRTAEGASISPEEAKRVMMRQIRRMLRNRRVCTDVVRRSRALDRQYHGKIRSAITATDREAEYDLPEDLGCGLKGDDCVNHGACSGKCQRKCRIYIPVVDICMFPHCVCDQT